MHITLGNFQRLFNLLEEECHQFNLSISKSCASSGSSFRDISKPDLLLRHWTKNKQF
uniref:Uncharacterized protein n=1 Tax=Amphimedon queenslandica TaxID=400682 RepID=A0A1X7VAM3_AMPQE